MLSEVDIGTCLGYTSLRVGVSVSIYCTRERVACRLADELTITLL